MFYSIARNSLCTFAILLTSGSALSAGVTEEEITACRNAPSVTCLADIGYAKAMEARDIPEIDQSVELLATLGRLDQARALATRNAAMRGQGNAEAMIEFRLQSYADLDDVLAKGAEGMSATELTAIVIRTAGLMSSGTRLGLRPTTDPERIEKIRKALPLLGQDRNAGISVAGILISLGDEEGARRVLDMLPVDTSHRSHLPDKIIQLIGTERALEIYQGMGEDLPWDWYYRTLARNEPDPVRARGFFAKALAATEMLEQNRRIGPLSALVRETAAAGHDDLAQTALERLEALPFEGGEQGAWNLSRLAMAQRAIGAPREDILGTLFAAEAVLEWIEDDNSLEQSSLAIARLFAGMGDIPAALRVFGIVEGDLNGWEHLISGCDSVTCVQAVMSEAGASVSSDDILALRARIARNFAAAASADDLKVWSHAELLRLLERAPPDDGLAQGMFYDNLTVAAGRLEDEKLLQKVLDHSIQEALSSGKYRPVIQAAHRLYWIENR